MLSAFDAMGGVSLNGANLTSTGAPFDQGTDTLWVFLLELLSAPQQYGHVICWTDYNQAEFKLYKPAEVANLWGRRKNRPAMNYDKLSRSLRYYYKKNILRKVPGRKYVYQFCRLDQLLQSLNPLNSPIASAYCQIFSQHLAANLYGQQVPPQIAQSQAANNLPVSYPHSQQPSAMLCLRGANSMPPMFNLPTAGLPQSQQQQFAPGAVSIKAEPSPFAMMHSNTPVSFNKQMDAFRSRAPASCASTTKGQQQPLTPSDDEASMDDEDDVDVEDAISTADRFDSNNPAFQVSPQTAFAQYAALDGNSQPESIPPRHQTPPISQITPSASGSEGRTPSIFSSSGEPPAKQANLESSSASSTSTSSPALKQCVIRPTPVEAVPSTEHVHAQPQQPISAGGSSSGGNNLADRRPLKRKPEPLKFTNSSAFSAANLATSSVPSSSNQIDAEKFNQQVAFLNTLQSVLSPFTARPFSFANPLSASLATPQTTDWLKQPSPRGDAPQAQPVSSFTFPTPLAQLAPLGIPPPLPSPMLGTPFFTCDSTSGGFTFNFPSIVPQSANMQSLLAAAHFASLTSSSSMSTNNNQ